MLSRAVKQLRVVYPSPATDCARRLRVLPPPSRGGQTLRACAWNCEPPPDASREFLDPFGNRVLELHHAAIAREFRFELRLEAETSRMSVPRETNLLPEGEGAFRLPSARCDGGPRVLESLSQSGVTREIARREPFAAASQLCVWTHGALRYEAGGGITRGASGALARGSGMCGEFAHVFIALCRASGLAARYIAGFNPAEGLMHAWAEVLCAQKWHTFDPTHGRALSAGSIAVACGRDARDVAPHEGRYRGQRGARLSVHCRTVAEVK